MTEVFIILPLIFLLFAMFVLFRIRASKTRSSNNAQGSGSGTKSIIQKITTSIGGLTGKILKPMITIGILVALFMGYNLGLADDLLSKYGWEELRSDHKLVFDQKVRPSYQGVHFFDYKAGTLYKIKIHGCEYTARNFDKEMNPGFYTVCANGESYTHGGKYYLSKERGARWPEKLSVHQPVILTTNGDMIIQEGEMLSSFTSNQPGRFKITTNSQKREYDKGKGFIGIRVWEVSQ